MKNFFVLVLLCVLCIRSSSQETQQRYVIGVKLLGGHKASCPVFVGGVSKNSPAAKAGIKPGDRLIAVDGSALTGLQDAVQRIVSTGPKPVTLQLARGETTYTVKVESEGASTVLQRDGWKLLPNRELVPSDATAAEIQYQHGVEKALENEKYATTLFPGHYPANKQLYYPGFEVFIWDNGNQVTVGGIEDGPASKAGVRWGDRILGVDSVDPRGRSVTELESLFSSPKPATMTLLIERAEVRKTYSFELAQAAIVLRDNQWQVINGRLVPLWVPEKYLPCFE